MTSKVTSKVTSSGTLFRYFWLDSKGREASGGLATMKAKQRECRERERERKRKQRTQNEAVTSFSLLLAGLKGKRASGGFSGERREQQSKGRERERKKAKDAK